jgi:hypothetical protein
MVSGQAPVQTQKEEYNIPTPDEMKKLLSKNDDLIKMRNDAMKEIKAAIPRRVLRGGKINKYLFKLQNEQITSNKFKLYLDKLNYYYNL